MVISLKRASNKKGSAVRLSLTALSNSEWAALSLSKGACLRVAARILAPDCFSSLITRHCLTDLHPEARFQSFHFGLQLPDLGLLFFDRFNQQGRKPGVFDRFVPWVGFGSGLLTN